MSFIICHVILLAICYSLIFVTVNYLYFSIIINVIANCIITYFLCVTAGYRDSGHIISFIILFIGIILFIVHSVWFWLNLNGEYQCTINSIDGVLCSIVIICLYSYRKMKEKINKPLEDLEQMKTENEQIAGNEKENIPNMDAKSFILPFIYLLILIFAASFDYWISLYFCRYIVNSHYLLYSLIIPVFITLLFFTNKDLKKWTKNVFSLYLFAFDIISDILIINEFIRTDDYQFAAIQILCLILAQILVVVPNYIQIKKKERDSTSYALLTPLDIILSIFGFSEAWFLIQSWINEEKYKPLQKKMKIWELFYQSIPSLCIQIYALMVIDVSVLLLAISITISTFSVIFSLMNLFGDVKENQQEAQNDEKLIKWMKKQYSNLKDTISWFLFSDFVIRSIPILSLSAAIDCNAYDEKRLCLERTFTFIPVLFVVGILEFILNRMMRKEGYRNWRFILQICPVSIFSAFYNLFCFLPELKSDELFGESVDFSLFIREQKIRLGLSFILMFCSVILFIIGDKQGMALILSIFLGICWMMNILSLYFIKAKFVDKETGAKDKKKEEAHQSNEVEMTDVY
eukprot:205351_1